MTHGRATYAREHVRVWVGTVQAHGRAFNRAQLRASRHGRAYLAIDHALPAISRAPPDGSPGLRRCFVRVRN